MVAMLSRPQWVDWVITGSDDCLLPHQHQAITSTNAESLSSEPLGMIFNTLRPRRNEQHFADDIFKRIFFDENVWISIKISLKFVPKGPINNIPALVQIMAWRRSDDKPLSEPMMVTLLMHICVTRPQWVNGIWIHFIDIWICIYNIQWFSFEEMHLKTPSAKIKSFVSTKTTPYQVWSYLQTWSVPMCPYK